MSQLCRQFIEKSVGFIDSQSSGVHSVGFVVKISRGCRNSAFTSSSVINDRIESMR
jgi:hypothetical protein